MKILHTESSCGWGGQEIRILEEARGMRERGHQVYVACPPEAPLFREGARYGVEMIPLSIARLSPRAILAFRRLLLHLRPDVVNSHSSTDTWIAAIASSWLRDAPPLVRTRHISAEVSVNPANRWLYGRAIHHVVTTGEMIRCHLIDRFGLPSARVTSVPTGVDPGRFHPGDKLAARRALGLDPDNRYVGIVATLRSWKGHLDLLQAFASMAAEGWRLLIVGAGPMQPIIEERIEASGITDRVHMVGKQDNPEDWLRALDIFCLPSYANEGVPQALLQAMFTALPIVTTAVGAIPEVVRHEESALIVAPRDTKALANALSRVMNDDNLAHRLSRAAYEAACHRYGRTQMLDAMAAIFAKVTRA